VNPYYTTDCGNKNV